MADGDTYVDLGGVRRVALGKPPTEDQAGYGALTWATFKGVLNWPDHGDEHTDVADATLDNDGRMEHLAGGPDGGVIEIPFRYIEGDAGQALVRGNVGNNQTISLQDGDQDGTAKFSYGVILSCNRNQKGTDSKKGYTLRVAVNSGAFEGVPELG